MAAAPLVDACAGERPLAPDERAIDVAALTRDGAGEVTAIVGPDGAPVLVIRTTAGHFVALSTQCTHEGCPVNPPSGGVITCPCHGSQYDLQGKVLRGPALYPLASWPARFDRRHHRVVVTLREPA
jgi:thiosulfate dehydrogenase (quinone) large subunit